MNDDQRRHTVEDLLAMTDSDFRQAVTDDMFVTSRFSGPFQHEDVVERTLLALVDWLWLTNAKIDDRAEDPTCPIEVYEKTVRYRSHLLSVIEQTERRVGWMKGTKERTLKKWRQVLHEVIDAIVEGEDDDDILAIKIPAFDGMQRDDMYDLNTWYQIRLEKDPRRVRKPEALAA